MGASRDAPAGVASAPDAPGASSIDEDVVDTDVDGDATSSAASAASGRAARVFVELPRAIDASPDDEGEAARDERLAWNAGGVGTLVRPPPAPEGHPEPRVIVDGVRVSGPHDAKETRRTLRASLWGRIVACYRLGAADRQDLRGSVALRLDVSAAGRVRGAHVTRAALPDRAVVACLRDAVTKVGLPRARGPSRVAMEIHVGPGDDPVAPQEGAVRPGPGVLDADRVRDAARAASPRLLACYEAALAYAPGLWGRLAARVRVAPSGAVTEAFEVETRFPDERVVRCVLRELRGATMPAPSGGDARIVVPLRFWTASS